MRFALLHKIASYLLALSGFAALALSEELSPIALALTLLLGAASFFLEPPRHALLRSRAWTTSWNVLSLAVFAVTGVALLRGEPFLNVAIQTLCFLLVNKLCNRRASRDYLQIYVLSFLMLVAGTTLNTDLVFAPCFLAYVVCATWALTLLHLRREIEENYLLKHTGGSASERVEVERVLGSRRVVGGAFLGVTSVMSAAIFLLSGAFFFTFPRIGWNAFFRHSRHGLQVGFSDKGVALGENGLIKDNEQVVMRVEFPAGRPNQPLYFRGISFERYRDGRWTPATDLAHHPLRTWGGIRFVGVQSTRQRTDGPLLRQKLDGALEQEIYLEPMESTVLFAASVPIAVSVTNKNAELGVPGIAVEGAWLEREAADEARTAHPTSDIYSNRLPGGVRYQAWSRLDPLDEKQLEKTVAPSAAQAKELADYLDTEGIPPRVIELARQITRDAATPWAKARAIQRYLGRDFRYSLQLVHDPRKEPIEEFLFDRKQGHCEYFASALALLLRAAGVPARHVAGFYGGEWNGVGRYLQVRQRDAHAWVEAWFGSAGWIALDPTPSSGALEGRPGIADRVRQLIDVMELSWFKYVIEYDLGTQMDLLSRARRWLAGGGSAAHEGGGQRATPDLKRPLSIAVALIVLVLAPWFAWRRRGREPGAPRRRAIAATRAIERAIRALERRGCERSRSDTPRELLHRAQALADPGAAAFSRLVDLYYAARFGGQPADPATLSALAAQVVSPTAGAGPSGAVLVRTPGPRN